MHLIQVKTTTGQSSTFKADRDRFKRLFSAGTSVRKVKVSMLPTNELASVHLSLASFDKDLRPTDKTVLSFLFLPTHTGIQNYPVPSSSTRISIS